jgi:hypothetical protein
MKKLKIIAGVTWALLCLILIIVLFPGLNSFSSAAASLPFMKINPNYTGGMVIKEMVSAGCTIDIRKPVFDGLIKKRKTGFVQVEWRGTLQEILSDTIDYDQDGNKDFIISINRKDSKTELNPLNDKVLNVSISTPTSYGWAVRIGLKNKV